MCFSISKRPPLPNRGKCGVFLAIGAAAEIKVLFNKAQIDYQFKIENAIIFTHSIPHPDRSLRYPLLFENLSSVVQKAKEILGMYFDIANEDLEALHFFGGWKASQTLMNNKEIAIFTLPKVTINQGEMMEAGSFLHPHFPAFSIEQINFCQWDDPFNQQTYTCSFV